jgi:hypothetical protein
MPNTGEQHVNIRDGKKKISELEELRRGEIAACALATYHPIF